MRPTFLFLSVHQQHKSDAAWNEGDEQPRRIKRHVSRAKSDSSTASQRASACRCELDYTQRPPRGCRSTRFQPVPTANVDGGVVRRRLNWGHRGDSLDRPTSATASSLRILELAWQQAAPSFDVATSRTPPQS